MPDPHGAARTVLALLFASVALTTFVLIPSFRAFADRERASTRWRRILAAALVGLVVAGGMGAVVLSVGWDRVAGLCASVVFALIAVTARCVRVIRPRPVLDAGQGVGSSTGRGIASPVRVPAHRGR